MQDSQYLDNAVWFLETGVGGDDGRCGYHRLTLELEKVLHGQVDVPAIAHVLYGLLAFIEQEKILLVNCNLLLVHGGQDFLVEAFGGGDDLSITLFRIAFVGISFITSESHDPFSILKSRISI